MIPQLSKREVRFNLSNTDIPLILNETVLNRSRNRQLLDRSPNDDDFKLTGDVFSDFVYTVKAVINESGLSTKWIQVTIIACAITITMVVLTWRIKKERTNTITYSPVYTSQRNQVSPVTDQHNAVDMSPIQPEVVISLNTGETMLETFIEDMARKKPIKYSAQDIEDFTGNRSFKLGSGGYGDVYRGKFKDGRMIAVKVLKDKQLNRIKKQFIAELGTLGITHHVNLVKLYGFCFDHTTRALVYEYMENGSLDKLLFGKNQQVEWQKLRQIAIGVARGLAYLHEYCEPEIIHYDIKPGNVLLDSELNPKVADFGLARLCNTESNSAESIRGPLGTVGYTAPELSRGNISLTNKCDVYSYGVLLLEIIGRRKNYKPYESNEDKQLLSYYTWTLWKKGGLKIFFEDCGIEEENQQEAERMLMVVFLCINDDPNLRPKMSNVVNMLKGEQEINLPLYPFEKWSSDEHNGSTSETNKKSSAALEME